jgi:hypothetical protein
MIIYIYIYITIYYKCHRTLLLSGILEVPDSNFSPKTGFCVIFVTSKVCFERLCQFPQRTVSVINESLSMEHWWKGTERGKPKYSEMNLSQCRVVQHKSPIN